MVKEAEYIEKLNELVKAKKADESILTTINDNELGYKKAKENLELLLKEIEKIEKQLEEKRQERKQIPIYKIKKIMEFGGPVLRRISRASGKEYESSYMNIYNREIVKDLKELGIVQNKTFILGAFDFVPKEYELDFIRGAFDGDGSVGRQGGEKCKNNYQIRVRFFSASKAFLTYIRDVLTQNGLTDVKIYQDLKRKTNFYYIIYSTNDSINFYNKIYNGASIYLDRKKEKFDELVSKRIEYENLIKNKNKLKVLTES